jgi:NADP-dependent 3-hydroxy acid dehydrogenase YdfG
MIENAPVGFGKPDILVSNAGVLFQSAVAGTSTDDWGYLIKVNLRGVFISIRGSLKIMPERDGSNMVSL